MWSEGFEPEDDFVRACMLEERRATRGWGASWRYLDTGRYGGQLQRLHRSFPPEQVLLVRYRTLREQPTATLNSVCAFLGVETDVVTEVPVENITQHATASLRNRVLGKALRTTRALDRRVHASALDSVDGLLTRQLLSEHRRRQPLTVEQRSRLIPYISDDVALLERLTGESYADWVDPYWRAQGGPAPTRRRPVPSGDGSAPTRAAAEAGTTATATAVADRAEGTSDSPHEPRAEEQTPAVQD
jgi:hypothetical protein